MVAEEVLMEHQCFDERVARILDDLHRLQTLVPGFEEGVTNDQLRFLVAWHLGRKERHAFNAVALKDEGLLRFNGTHWGRRAKLCDRSHVIVHQPCRPDLPDTLTAILVKEAVPTRSLYRKMRIIRDQTGYRSSARTPGEQSQYNAPTRPDTYTARKQNNRRRR